MQQLIELTAREAVALLRKKQVSPLELVDAAIARIEEVEPAVNALPTRCFERARDQAKRLMNEGVTARQERLAGLPVAIKDLSRLAGVRTTWGSPIFRDHVPEQSDIGVDTLEKSGAIPIAKSNVPELGIGANTTNPVFGATRNPWNTDLDLRRLIRRCGGERRNRRSLAGRRLRRRLQLARAGLVLLGRGITADARPRRIGNK